METYRGDKRNYYIKQYMITVIKFIHTKQTYVMEQKYYK